MARLSVHWVANYFSDDNSECIATPDIDDSFSFEERNKHWHHFLSTVTKTQAAQGTIAPAIQLFETIESHHVISTEGQICDLLLLKERVGRGALLVVVRSRPLMGTFAPDVKCATLHGDA